MSGSPSPAITILIATVAALPFQGMTFDKNGNLWAGTPSVSIPTHEGNVMIGGLFQYSKAQLAISGSPTPAVTISSVANPTGMAIDSKGDLWVGNSYYSSGVCCHRYYSKRFAKSGESIPTPQPVRFINSPLSVLFDSADDLVVINVLLEHNRRIQSRLRLLLVGGPSPNLSQQPERTSGFVSITFGSCF